MTQDHKINCTVEQPISFVPTRDELTVLVRHWVSEAIWEEYSIFLGSSFGSSELDRFDYARKRINDITEVLGDELTRTTVEETHLQAAQQYDRDHWIIFRYGTGEEQSAYEKLGDPRFREFHKGVAEKLASQVVDRVFREGPAEQQMSLLKEELMRYSITLHTLKSGAGHIIEIFGINFPSKVKQLVLSAGIEDPSPHSGGNTFFKTITLEQGKAILTALNETARQGESALKALTADS